MSEWSGPGRGVLGALVLSAGALGAQRPLTAVHFQVIRASRFEPARRAGPPVRQLVQQVIAWYEESG